MITKIESKKVELPLIYLIENEEDFKTLPKGLPYIIGDKSELNFITTFLEFQTLLKSCLKTGIPIKWLDTLKKIGYNVNSIRTYEIQSGGTYSTSGSGEYILDIDDFIEDSYLVNFDKLSELKILPAWLEDIKAAIETNIIDEVMFDPLAFNKQLGINVGYSNIKHNEKNLLILDISSSMPKSVVMTITQLAKLMSKKFYADVILTGKQSYLIDYENVPNTDIVGAVRSYGGGNEGDMFWDIIKEPKVYNTIISFGDNDNPMYYSTLNKCNFKCETLYSLHTDKRSNEITGYSRPFKPKNVHKVQNWITTIDK